MSVTLYLPIASVKHVCPFAMLIVDLCFCALVRAEVIVVKVMLAPESIIGLVVLRDVFAAL